MKNPLGRKMRISDRYDPAVLYAIERKRERRYAGLEGISFTGFDIWYAYELSWIDPRGKPQNRVLKLVCPADSHRMLESKSFKLYLAGFAMTTFEDDAQLVAAIKRDLAFLLETSFLQINLLDYREDRPLCRIPEEQLLDRLDVHLSAYKPDKALLQAEDHHGGVIERYSHLLRTTCPITGQPDWATVYCRYKSGLKITDPSLLAYLVSFRTHRGFHESTCEIIFHDLYRLLKPELLAVKCFYTRRGGIEINPFRYYGGEGDAEMPFRFFRQ